MESKSTIICDSVSYRQGYIEVQSDIHKGYINLEVWGIHPDVEIQGVDLYGATINDSDVVGNVELELSLEKAKALIEKLHQAVSQIELGNNT